MNIYKFKDGSFYLSNISEIDAKDSELIPGDIEEYKIYLQSLLQTKKQLGVDFSQDIDDAKTVGIEQNWINQVIKKEQDNIDEKNNKHEAKNIERNKKLSGFEFEGVMCSSTRDDQNGLLAIAYKLQIMGENFTPTVFEFDNGNKLTLTRQNFVEFQQKWLTFRDQFFQQNEVN